MGGRIVSKERAGDVLSAARLSALATAARCEPSQELETWLSGFLAAVDVVSLGLGLEGKGSDDGLSGVVPTGAMLDSEALYYSTVPEAHTGAAPLVRRLRVLVGGSE